MKSDYLGTDMSYSEMIVTLENFNFNSKVKCSIPSLMPFLSKSEITNDINRPNHMNIMNTNISILGIGKCTSCNYIEVYIPDTFDISGKGIGKKGDEFVIIFIGGNINKYTVIGRYNK